MKTFIGFLLTLSVLLGTSLAISQNTRFSDPTTVVQNEFWGNLYAQRGTSSFCDTPFTSKGFLLTDGDIARTVAYMVYTYDLPWAGATRVFKSWNRTPPRMTGS